MNCVILYTKNTIPEIRFYGDDDYQLTLRTLRIAFKSGGFSKIVFRDRHMPLGTLVKIQPAMNGFGVYVDGCMVAITPTLSRAFTAGNILAHNKGAKEALLV